MGEQNYKKMWKYSVVGFMTRKKINLAWKNSDVYLGEDEIETSWDLHDSTSWFLSLCVMSGFQIYFVFGTSYRNKLLL